MNRPMTAAQAAQQRNRDRDGRYAEGQLADPGQILDVGAAAGPHPDLELWADVAIPAPAAGQRYIDGTPATSGDFNACYTDFIAPLDTWEARTGDSYTPLTQAELAELAGFNPMGSITTTHQFEATGDGILVRYPDMAAPSILRPVDPDAYQREYALDLRTKLRDRIRAGQLPPWAILTPNPDTQVMFDVEEQVLTGDLHMYARRADDWDTAIAAGEKLLAEATFKPAKDVGWYSDKYLEARSLNSDVADYRRSHNDLADARQKKAAANAEIADFAAVIEQHPELSDTVKLTLEKGRQHAEYDLQHAESEERDAHKRAREALAHVTRRLPLAVQARTDARKAAVEAENSLAGIEARKVWELSWPGHHTTVPAQPEQ